MQITKNGIDTAAGPSDWFGGMVYIDTVATPSGASRLSASSVHFTPGARTAWHTHPNGQTIYVLEGVGGLDEASVGDGLDPDVAGAVHDSCAHVRALPFGLRRENAKPEPAAPC